jgi:hypothetical protein
VTVIEMAEANVTINHYLKILKRMIRDRSELRLDEDEVWALKFAVWLIEAVVEKANEGAPQ